MVITNNQGVEIIKKYSFTAIFSLVACADVPSSDIQRIVGKVDSGNAAVALFATEQENKQYCVYQNKLSFQAWLSNPASAFAVETATLLTTHSVSADDLSEALLLESNAYNTAPSTFYPLLLCAGSLVSLPIVHKKLWPASLALLSCGAAALLMRQAVMTATKGGQVARHSIEQLLADNTHTNDTIAQQLPRVLFWLTTENSQPCPATKTQQDTHK